METKEDKEKILHVRIEKTVKEELLDFCDHRDYSVSWLIRRLVKLLLRGQIKI